MTDKELLELAAKAAEMPLGYGDGEYFWCQHGPFGESMYGRRGNAPLHWNPLADDGDALRLAAKLKIDLEWQNVGAFPEPNVEAYRRVEEGPTYCASENEGDYRRAIVRAAAEIGKAMP